MINIDNSFFQERVTSLCELIGLKLNRCSLFKESIGGTNTTFFVQCDNEYYVFRIASRKEKGLGINREAERQATSIASQLGIGFSLIYFDISTGDMITKFVEGHTTSDEEIKQKNHIDTIANILRSFHSNSIDHIFDPFKDISHRHNIIQKYSTLSNLAAYKEAMAFYNSIKGSFVLNDNRFYGLCHNDSNNFNLYISSAGKLYLIDYEYSGMGNVFFDIACLCGSWEYDSQKAFLTSYFNQFEDMFIKYLNEYYILSLIWNGTWAYVKSLDNNFVDIDYVSWANEQFETAIKISNNEL